MKYFALFVIVPLFLLTGCSMWSLPAGETPDDLTGPKPSRNRQTQASAESAMAVSLTRFVVVNQLNPAEVAIIPDGVLEKRFLESLDRNLFHRADGRNYRYLLVSRREKNQWTLSLKKKNASAFLWTKTVKNIQAP